MKKFGQRLLIERGSKDKVQLWLQAVVWSALGINLVI